MIDLTKNILHSSCSQQSVNEDLYKAVDDYDIRKIKDLISKNGPKWLEKQLKISAKRGKSLIEIAAVGGLRSEKITDLFLKYFPEAINLRNSKMETPLHVAVKYHDVGSVQFLLSKYADVNLKDEEGKTALHHAVKAGSLFVEVLLKHGADVNIRDKDKRTPIDECSLAEKEWGFDLEKVKEISESLPELEICPSSLSVDTSLTLSSSSLKKQKKRKVIEIEKPSEEISPKIVKPKKNTQKKKNKVDDYGLSSNMQLKKLDTHRLNKQKKVSKISKPKKIRHAWDEEDYRILADSITFGWDAINVKVENFLQKHDQQTCVTRYTKVKCRAKFHQASASIADALPKSGFQIDSDPNEIDWGKVKNNLEKATSVNVCLPEILKKIWSLARNKKELYSWKK